MRLALIFSKARADTIGIYFERALAQLGVPYDFWAFDQRDAIPATYDLYLRIDHGDDYDAPWPPQLRPSIYVVTDTHLAHNWPKVRRAARRYGLLACVHDDAVPRLPNAVWLPVGCDPTFAPAGPVARTLDVAFVGTDGGVPRKFILQALRERYPNSYIGTALHTQLPALYSRARVGFNYSIRGEINMRVFETLAAGALLVTNRVRPQALAALGLREGEHYVAYGSPHELWECLDRWLADADHRERIAAAGHAVAVSRHTYVHRVQQLLAAAKQRLKLSTRSA